VTPARRAELIAGVEAALALEGGVLAGREHIEALLLWFASSPPGLTVMDAVVAGYRVDLVRGGFSGPATWAVAPPFTSDAEYMGPFVTQADAWRAALRHMADAA
jgi:hypothetical protein